MTPAGIDNLIMWEWSLGSAAPLHRCWTGLEAACGAAVGVVAASLYWSGLEMPAVFVGLAAVVVMVWLALYGHP